MNLISVFNNKGGVGKTTLTFHLGHALASLGKRVLLIDLDPQCNLTILSLPEEEIHDIWVAEDTFIDDFKAAQDRSSATEFASMLSSVRTAHFLLKPTEDGVTDINGFPPPRRLAASLDIIPGRLSMHLYEDKISSRWSDVYQGDPLAIRTVTRIRDLAIRYAEQNSYDCVILDTSPSLSMLNRVVISTADGFLIPCMPDLFSLYGIKNIGNALAMWEKQFRTIFHLLSSEKMRAFPERFVKLLGFTIYNAKKYSGNNNPWDLATAHYNYAKRIPGAIADCVPSDLRAYLGGDLMGKPIGGTAIMHSHNTLPSMAQKYHLPIWALPDCDHLEASDAMTIRGNRSIYEDTKAHYQSFAMDLLRRLEKLP
jgi:cellulose biosynthesis protein BcsQ